MTDRTKCSLSGRWRAWLRVAAIAVVLLLTILLNGALMPRVTDAAPLVQSPTDLCTLFPPGYISVSPPTQPTAFGFPVTSADFCLGRYNFGDLSIRRTVVGGCRTLIDSYMKSGRSSTVYGEIANEVLATSNLPLDDPKVKPQDFDLTNAPYSIRKLGGGDDINLPYAGGYELRFCRGCYYVDADAVLDDPKIITYFSLKVPSGAGDSIRQTATQIDSKLKGFPACTGGQPPAQPAAAATFGVGHGCSYNSPQYSAQVFCAASTTNAPVNATIEYQWAFDGEAPAKGNNTFSRRDDNIAPGTHTITVVAKDTKNNKQASSSFTFIKAGADLYVSVQCALRSGDDPAVACYADPKNVPEGTTLTYEWTWSGTREGESSRTLNKTNLADGVYNISVRAKDSKSGKYTLSASTSITIGKPPAGISVDSLAAGINSALTGTANPNPPDPAAAAAAGAVISVLLGAGALVNALTSAGGVAAHTTASGTRAQTATPADSQQPPSTTEGEPGTLPDEEGTLVAGKTPKPTQLPGQASPVKPTNEPEQKPATASTDETKSASASTKTDKSDSDSKATTATEGLRFMTGHMGKVDWGTKPDQKPAAAPTDDNKSAEWKSKEQDLNRRITEAKENAASAEWRAVDADDKVARAVKGYKDALGNAWYWESKCEELERVHGQHDEDWTDAYDKAQKEREKLEHAMQTQQNAIEALHRAEDEREKAQAHLDELQKQLSKHLDSGDPTKRGGAK